LKYKPKVITYYGLEPLDQARFSLSVLKKDLKSVDLAIFPESNRLKKDAPEFTDLKAIFEILNTQSKFSSNLIYKESELIYAGTLDPGWIEFGYLEAIDKRYDLKVFGDSTEIPKNLSSTLRNYRGLLSENDLRLEIEKSMFSIVCWKPNNFSLFNAAPNKLFQSLSCGTPVITYPYPQAVKLGETFSGIFVAKDFSIESLIDITEQALDFDDNSYSKLLGKVATEFSQSMIWSKQVEAYLNCLKGCLYD
jgi:glycosyltransferase involved in cell wall biosynthesis